MKLARPPRQASGQSRHQRFAAPHPKLERWRVWLVVGFLLSLFAVLLGRGLYLQAWNEGFLQEQGDARYMRNLKQASNRGMITDRNGEPLAISTPVQSIWASPRGITLLPAGQERPKDWEPKSEKDPVPVSRSELKKLAAALQLPEEELNRKLSVSRKNSRGEEIRPDFLWLRRHMPPNDAKAVMALNVPGVYTQTEYRRYYPAGDVMAHIVGFTDIDGKGQEGFELTREAMLAGKPGSRTVIRDRRGYIVEDVSTVVPAKDGETLQLSIDRKIQYLAYRELKKGIETAGAVAGAAVVLDAKTGEVLALANLPSYNPNSRERVDLARKRNRVLTDIYEPGSTMKPFIVAAGLEQGLIKPSSMIQTSPGQMTIGPATFKDTRNYGTLNPEGILKHSSNVGAAKIGLMMGREELWGYFNNYGFGASTHSGFPGEAFGRVRPWKTWRPIEQATMSFGHGISVSLMQMARGYTVFTNHGEMKPITFTKMVAPSPGKQVVSAQTADLVRNMLESVTQAGGTAARAQIVGFRVGGKTGTARKIVNGQYSREKYEVSFIGFAPVSNPRLIVAVLIDEPSTVGNRYYGGTVSAPVFQEIMSGSLRMLGVPPDAPITNILLPGLDAPELKEET
ncbi:peptidoglycan D,D-transpeptidase FtsI family protein [Iodobacter ciconiae]|uniref:Peptidoglycan D,D-transpeptidase FtsI n=1 Tax=Iodobacter ciconiae TaxID=2496266 RepID=A0A3S8ZW18_9NEIS|nr:penicillin-binding protein 2 [Iodobacter ciconiae]AZN37672.1 penicillin-binding protein 2 [Iodobacter ciconiae]